MSDLLEKPVTTEAGLPKSLAFLFLIIVIGAFVFFNYSVWQNAQRPKFETDYSAFFKTPLNDVELSDFWINHGHNNFFVKAISGNLILREDRGFRSVDCHHTPFVLSDKPWIARCFYQPHDRYLTGWNDDAWVYTDSILSKAFVVEDSHGYEHLGVTAIKPMFEKFFRNSFAQVNFNDFYLRGKDTYFDVVSPKDLASVAPKLLLQDSLSFQKIDPKFIIVGDPFPPRHKGQTWMTTCFYHLPENLSVNDHEEVWVFFNDDMTRAFVIAKDKQI